MGTDGKDDVRNRGDAGTKGPASFRRLRLELSTTGVDEALQGISSDPGPAQAYSTWTGLRIPAVLSAAATPATQPRYLFCLASTTFQDGIKLLGLRQGLTIGVDANEGIAPERPIEAFVTTPTFRFVDGNVSWHCVVERQPKILQGQPNTSTQNWQKLQSDGPAMLYQSFTNSNVNPATGAPIVYSLGLTAYAPPQLSGSWEELAGLSNMHDIRFPWNSGHAWSSLGEGVEIPGSGRLSFYASVLQSNPLTRGLPTVVPSGLSSNAAPEECFIQNFSTVVAENNLGPVFWRVMGSLIVEKKIVR